jgi:small subunit ribosomal protein S5
MKNRNENDKASGANNESEQFVVSVNRTTKVVKGGRRFGIAVLMVVGDKKGRVGFGLGKANEVTEARAKAVQAASKALIKVSLKENRTLHHDIKGGYGAGNVVLRSAPPGTGIIAGGPMRAIFEAVGIHDIVAKCVGSRNPHCMVRSTFDALKKLNSPKSVAERRSLRVSDIIERRELSE